MDAHPADDQDRRGALSHDRPCGHCGHPGCHSLIACDLCDCHDTDH